MTTFPAILTIAIALCFVVFLLRCLFAHSSASSDPREFQEPQDDARFENLNLGSLPPAEMVEINTAGQAMPPAQVMVYRYRWNPALGRMDVLSPIPLSRYCILQDEPEIEQVLGRRAPITWDHSAIKLPSGPAVTAHGAPLDCALGASPLPAGLGKFEV